MDELPTQLSLLGTMGFRKCIRCSREKPVTAFAWREKVKGRRFAHCRACQAKYHRKHYEENRAMYIAKASARTNRILEERWKLMLEYLRDNPCVDCGESDPVVLEFDHLQDKEFDISSGLRNRSWVSVLVELEKCEVVCGNCHRRRTSRRGRHWRSRATTGLDPL